MVIDREGAQTLLGPSDRQLDVERVGPLFLPQVFWVLVKELRPGLAHLQGAVSFGVRVNRLVQLSIALLEVRHLPQQLQQFVRLKRVELAQAFQRGRGVAHLAREHDRVPAIVRRTVGLEGFGQARGQMVHQ